MWGGGLRPEAKRDGREQMTFERIALNEILEDREIVQGLREAVQRRLAFSDETEHEKVHALTNRAMHPECSFDRKHRLMLCALALAPEEVGWAFKLRERIHRVLYHD